jgi:hypothetical protein
MTAEFDTIIDAAPTSAEAHASAWRAHASAQVAETAAKVALDAVIAARTKLLDDVANGGDVQTSDLRAHEDGIRTLEADLLLAKHRREGKERLMWKLEVPALKDDAGNLDAAVHAAAKIFLGVSEECDADLAALRLKQVIREDAHQALLAALQASRRHNITLAERAKVNETLRDQHPSVHPKADVSVNPLVDRQFAANFTTPTPGLIGSAHEAVAYTMADRCRWMYSKLLGAPATGRVAN